MSLRLKTIDGMLSMTAGQLCNFTFRLGTLAVMSRFLNAEQYGLFAIVSAITSILSVLQEGGLSSATVQAPKLSELASNSMYTLNIGIGAAVFLVACAIGPIANMIYGGGELLLMFPIMGLASFVKSFRFQQIAILQREMRFRLLATVDVISQGASAATGIALAVMGFGVWALVAMVIAQALIYAAVLRVFQKGHFRFEYSHAEVKPLLHFGSRMLGVNLVARLSADMDAIIVGSYLGTGSLGIFNRAKTILQVPLEKITSPVSSVGRAAIFRAAEDEEKFQRSVTTVIKVISLGSAVLLLGSLTMAEVAVVTLLGKDWHACVPIFMALTPFAFVEPSASFLNAVLISKGNAGALLKWKIFNVVIVAAALALGVQWGVMGAALGYSLAGLLIRFPLLLVYCSRTVGLKLSELFGAIVPHLLGCAIAGMVIAYKYMNTAEMNLMESLVTLVLVGSIYLATILIIRSSRETVYLIFDLAMKAMRGVWGRRSSVWGHRTQA